MENDNNNVTNNNGDGSTKKRIEFTAEQAERVNEIVRERLGRANKGTWAENLRLKEKLVALGALDPNELDADIEAPPLRSAHDADGGQQAPPAAAVATPQSDNELEQLRRRLAEVETARRTDKRYFVLLDAARRANAIDPEIMVGLLEKSIEVTDEGNLRVMGEAGTPRLNQNFEPVSLNEFVTSFANERPWMVRGEVKSGAGSSEATRQITRRYHDPAQYFGSKSDSRAALELKKRDPGLYAELKKAAREKGLIG